jgi:hypothetical protein
MESLYPWHQVATDISVEYELNDSQNSNGLEQKIADELCADIMTGKLGFWHKDYTPVRKSITISELLNDPPHLTVPVVNAWLNSHGYLHEWSPLTAAKHGEKTQIDFKKLASPEQLIKAFAASTGMEKKWFSRNHSTKLRQARIVKGTPGPKGVTALYCPMKVLIWLTTKRGRKLAERSAWSLLEGHFPDVFKEHSAADPR